MENQIINFLDYYKQSKQRVDLDIDFKNKKISGKTNLTFLIKEDFKFAKQPSQLLLKLNSENMIIKGIHISTYSKSSSNNNGDLLKKNNNFGMHNNCNMNSTNNINNNKSFETFSFNNPNGAFTNANCEFNGNANNANNSAQVFRKIKFSYINPENYIEYLKNLYNCVEDSESIKNLNRIEWESKLEGKLNLEIPMHYITEENNAVMSDEENEKFVSSPCEKIKIFIDYELYKNYSGIIFQDFYDEKIDSEYDVCYTPNFVKINLLFYFLFNKTNQLTKLLA